MPYISFIIHYVLRKSEEGMATIRLEGIELYISGHPDVYEPSEDTFMLLEALGDALGRALEIGTGSGIVAIWLAKRGLDVVATDLNPHALVLARANAHRNGVALEAVRTDMFDGIRGPFDTIVFNPPYLPTAPQDVTGDRWLDASVNGGPNGQMFTRRFLAGLEERLGADGAAYIVSSSLSGFPKKLPAGLVGRVVAEKKLEFELLCVHRIGWS
jgi:release factor glutamine methyltransferase